MPAPHEDEVVAALWKLGKPRDIFFTVYSYYRINLLAAKATIRLMWDKMPNFVSPSFKAQFKGHLENLHRVLWSQPEYSYQYIRDESHIPFELWLRKYRQGSDTIDHIFHKFEYMALLHLTQKLYDQWKSNKHEMPTFNEACGIALNLPEFD
jgi:hypothetical protein